MMEATEDAGVDADAEASAAAKALSRLPKTAQLSEKRPGFDPRRDSGQHAMVPVTLADGSVLDSTDGHPIWDASTSQFTDPSKLHVGIETDTGALITIAELTTYTADLTAYNLQIGTIHTYYAGTTPVLVHNSCGEPNLSELPRGARTTMNERTVFQRLQQYHSIDANTASARLHAIKDAYGPGGADNVTFDLTGNTRTGEYLGFLTQP
jgi:hypothetical protein